MPGCRLVGASTEEGNLLAEEEQWAKLARIVEVAKEVWGG
jgi:5-methyltetrahydropteroyltriglutamate--homocysteine methyltransferase